MTRLVLAVLAALLLALPATAGAQGDKNAPPGNSAIDEYLETVPDASGNKPPRRPEDPAPAATALPPEQRVALEKEGPDGKALADLVEATAPPSPAPDPEHAAEKSGSGRPGAAATAAAANPNARAILDAEDRAPSPLQATLAATVGANDGGGLGIFFPIILVASLLGMVALAIRRRRPLGS